MPIIQCEVERKTLYEVYVEYNVSQDPIKATSTISHSLKLKQLTANYDFDGTMNISYKINDTSFTYRGRFDIDDSDTNDAGEIHTIKTGDSITVQHNTTSGVGNFTVECSGTCDSGGYGPGTITLAKKTVALPTIDRVAPNVSVTVSEVTSNSFKISATSHAVPDLWEYSINNGTTWVQFSISNNKSVLTIVTGLSPNTTYQVKVRAKRQYNQVTGVSSATSVKTSGGSVINHVEDIVITNGNIHLEFGYTTYGKYKHKLEVKYGNTVLMSEQYTDKVFNLGQDVLTVFINDSDISKFVNVVTDKVSENVTLELTTYDGNTQIGDVSTHTAKVVVSNELAPTVLTIIPMELNTSVNQLLGGVKRYVKNYSSIYFGITVKSSSGSTIKSFRVISGSHDEVYDEGEFTMVSATNGVCYYLTYNAKTSGENTTFSIEAIDSRGFSGKKDITLYVYDYNDISIDQYSIRRKNEVEPTAQLTFSGKYSSINVDSTEKNSIKYCAFRYRVKGTEEWSGKYGLSGLKISNGSFSCTVNELSTYSGVINFDSDKQYEIEITVEDAFTSDSLTIVLNKGTPLVSLRSKKVGINEPHPTAALHVRVDETNDEVPFKINDTTVPYIVESGYVDVRAYTYMDIEGEWYYEKWSNGIAKAWTTVTFNNVSFSNNWDNKNILYESPELAISYPSKFDFKDVPFSVIAGVGGDTGYTLEFFGTQNPYKLGNVYAVRPSMLANKKVILSFYVHGRWK